MQPVLYLDLDDTLISWAEGTPAAAAGLREFLPWVLASFEVRWLTRWAPEGSMPQPLLHDLARLSGVEAELLAGVRGISWAESGSKLDGIAWLEHLVLGRPFVWLEDDTMEAAALELLTRLGLRDSWLPCAVTRDADAVLELRRRLESRLRQATSPAYSPVSPESASPSQSP